MSASDKFPSSLGDRRSPIALPPPAEVVLGKISDAHRTQADLQRFLNANGLDSYCGTPDFILAEEVLAFINAKRKSVRDTAEWHGWRVREL